MNCCHAIVSPDQWITPQPISLQGFHAVPVFLPTGMQILSRGVMRVTTKLDPAQNRLIPGGGKGVSRDHYTSQGCLINLKMDKISIKLIEKL
jgi:hypothetical protein